MPSPSDNQLPSHNAAVVIRERIKEKRLFEAQFLFGLLDEDDVSPKERQVLERELQGLLAVVRDLQLQANKYIADGEYNLARKMHREMERIAVDVPGLEYGKRQIATQGAGGAKAEVRDSVPRADAGTEHKSGLGARLGKGLHSVRTKLVQRREKKAEIAAIPNVADQELAAALAENPASPPSAPAAPSLANLDLDEELELAGQSLFQENPEPELEANTPSLLEEEVTPPPAEASFADVPIQPVGSAQAPVLVGSIEDPAPVESIKDPAPKRPHAPRKRRPSGRMLAMLVLLLAVLGAFYFLNTLRQIYSDIALEEPKQENIAIKPLSVQPGEAEQTPPTEAVPSAPLEQPSKTGPSSVTIGSLKIEEGGVK